MKRIFVILFFSLTTVCVSAQKADSLNILLFGHSYGVDCTEYLPLLMAESDITTVRIARFKKSNCSLKERYNFFVNDYSAGFSECVPGSTEWIERSCTFKEAVAERAWDYVVFQNSLENQGRYNTAQPYLNDMVSYVCHVQQNMFGKDPKICWNMFWPMSKLLEDTTNKGLARRMEPYGHDSDQMWEAYVRATKELMEDTGIENIIPSGTAVMNARASYLNTSEAREFTKDGYHMSSGVGRYIAACSWFEYFITPKYGVSVFGNTLRLPDAPSPVTDENAEFLQTCAVEAVKHPFSIKNWKNELASSSKTMTRLVREVKPFEPLRYVINAGVDEPFSVLHISDVHLAKADRRDSASIQALPGKRAKLWSEYYLNQAFLYAKSQNLKILNTGDMIDFVSEANLDQAAAYFQMYPMFVCPGNHEYARMDKGIKEDDQYKAKAFDNVQSAYPVKLEQSSRIIGGVNFIALDNSYYKFTKSQWEFVKKEFKKGLPVVLMCHIPFYSTSQCEYALKQSKGKCASLIGAPDSITSQYSEARKEQQQADQITLDFIEWLRKQTNLKAIISGHCHYNFVADFSETAKQFTVGALFNGDAYEFEIR